MPEFLALRTKCHTTITIHSDIYRQRLFKLGQKRFVRCSIGRRQRRHMNIEIGFLFPIGVHKLRLLLANGFINLSIKFAFTQNTN